MISGNVVVGPEVSRIEISNACQYGDDGIENLFVKWLERIPSDSQELYDALILSCKNVTSDPSSTVMDGERYKQDEHRYIPMSKEEQRERIKQIFSQLVEKGTSPNDAALRAIQQVAKEIEERKANKRMRCLGDVGKNDESSFAPENVSPEILSLLLKYIDNIEKHPSNVKFRTIKFSNKKFDMVTSTLDRSELLEYLGFHIFPTDIDFVATVPLASDVSRMKQFITEMLEHDPMDIYT